MCVCGGGGVDRFNIPSFNILLIYIAYLNPFSNEELKEKYSEILERKSVCNHENMFINAYVSYSTV